MLRYLPLIAAAGFLAACEPAPRTEVDSVSPPEDGPLASDETAGQASPPDEAPRQAGSECSTVTVEGLCGVTFGMTAEEAMVAHASGLEDMGGAAEPEACYYLGPEPGNYDVGYMVVDGQVQRIDIRAPGVSTSEGVEVGMPAGEVEGIYPNLERAPNKYTDRDNLIVNLGGDTKLIMETDETGNIASYRVGIPPAVDYVEGCA